MAEEKKRRHLPVVSSGEDREPEAVTPLFVVLSSAFFILFVWLGLAVLVNGRFRPALARAGLVEVANVVALFVDGAACAAFFAGLEPRIEARHLRYGAMLAATVGWTLPFIAAIVAQRPTLSEILTWLLILCVMGAAAVLGTTTGRLLVAGRRR